MPRLSGSLDIVQVSDPATPVAGRQHLYFKSDGKLYTKTSAGVVTAVGPNPVTVIDGGPTPTSPYDGTTS